MYPKTKFKEKKREKCRQFIKLIRFNGILDLKFLRIYKKTLGSSKTVINYTFYSCFPNFGCRGNKKANQNLQVISKL